MTVSPANEVLPLFGEPSTRLTKKRSRKHLSDDKKIDSAFANHEGVRAVRTFLLAAIKPAAATSSNPVMDLMVDYLSIGIENIKSRPSALELACTNTSAKRCATQAHQKLPGGGQTTPEGGAAACQGHQRSEHQRHAPPCAQGRKGYS